MPETPKKIAFEDIKVGDTIRIVDVSDDVVTEHRGGEIVVSTGGTRLENPPRSKTIRTFQLIDRPLPALPTEYGSVIVVAGEVYMLRRSPANQEGVWQGTGGQHDWYDTTSMERQVRHAGGFEVIR